MKFGRKLFFSVALLAVSSAIFVVYRNTQKTLQNLSIQTRIVLHGEAFKARIAPSMLLGDVRSPQLLLCLEGEGTGCNNFDGEWMRLADALFGIAPRMSSTGELCHSFCSIERTLEFRPHCSSPRSCETIEVRSQARSKIFAGLSREMNQSFDGREALQSARRRTAAARTPLPSPRPPSASSR
ncbi:MAG: hypothetical protein ABIR96_07070 [Bdellovibrionota bacterium]